MASLYELSAKYAAFLEAYESASCEEEAAEVLQSLVDIHGSIEEKAEVYAKIIKIEEAEARGFKEEADRLTKRRQAAENMVARLKAAMLDAMKLTGQDELKTSIGKWRVQMNPLSCEVVNVDMVPKEYRIPQPDKVDRRAILAAFSKTGEIPSGVEIKREEGVRFR